jgi:hypothetical protein
MRLVLPWQFRNQRFSWLKASTFALMFVPAIWLIDQIATEQFGPVPLGGMTYWSGLFATGLLMLALAITPMAAVFAWPGHALSCHQTIADAGIVTPSTLLPEGRYTTTFMPGSTLLSAGVE